MRLSTALRRTVRFGLAVALFGKAAVGAEGATAAIPEVVLQYSQQESINGVFQPREQVTRRGSGDLSVTLLEENGFYLTRQGLDAAKAVTLLQDGAGKDLRGKDTKSELRANSFFLRGKYRSGYSLRWYQLLPADAYAGGLRVAGALPVRRAVTLRQIEISPLGELKEQKYEFPGGACKVWRKEKSVFIQTDFQSPLTFLDEAGKAVAKVQRIFHNGAEPEGHREFRFDAFPEKGALRFALPDKAEELTCPFDFQTQPVDVLLRGTKTSEKEAAGARLSQVLAKFQTRYRDAPLVEGFVPQAVWQSSNREFSLWAQGKESGVSLYKKPNLTVCIQVEQGNKPETTLAQTEFFCPLTIEDDTGKSLIGNAFRTQIVYVRLTKEQPKARLNLDNLLLPDAKATKIARLEGEIYYLDGDKQPRRIAVKLKDIPLCTAFAD